MKPSEHSSAAPVLHLLDPVKNPQNRLSGLGKTEYLAFLTELGLGRRFGVGNRTPRSLPTTNNIFHSLNGEHVIRSCIVADPNQEIDLLPQYTDGDVTTVIWQTNITGLSRKANTNPKKAVRHNKGPTNGGEPTVKLRRNDDNNKGGRTPTRGVTAQQSVDNTARLTTGPIGRGDHRIEPHDSEDNDEVIHLPDRRSPASTTPTTIFSLDTMD